MENLCCNCSDYLDNAISFGKYYPVKPSREEVIIIFPQITRKIMEILSKHINIPKWAKFTFLVIIFQICFFISQLTFSYLMDWIFKFNFRIGINRWNYWIFDYSSSEAYLNSFWGIVSADFYSLILSIFITLGILKGNDKLWGWRILLVYRVITKILLLSSVLLFQNSDNLFNIGYSILFIILDLIPFGIYRFKKYVVSKY